MKNNIMNISGATQKRLPKTIRVKNDLVHILEALCYHRDCPEWLKDGIWELFNECAGNVVYTANYWAAQFDGFDSENVRRLEAKLNRDQQDEMPPKMRAVK